METPREPPVPGRLLTVGEVARLLHVHPNTVRLWSDRGLLFAYRVGPRGDRRFAEEEVVRFLNSYQGPERGLREARAEYFAGGPDGYTLVDPS